MKRKQLVPPGEVELLDPDFLEFEDAEDATAEIAALVADAGEYE